MNVTLGKSTRKGKKYMVVIITKETGRKKKKTIHFGASGFSDFTKHKDKDRRDRYDARHKVNEDWSDPMTAGFWAKWILWNKETIQDSILDTQRRFPSLGKIGKKTKKR